MTVRSGHLKIPQRISPHAVLALRTHSQGRCPGGRQQAEPHPCKQSLHICIGEEGEVIAVADLLAWDVETCLECQCGCSVVAMHALHLRSGALRQTVTPCDMRAATRSETSCATKLCGVQLCQPGARHEQCDDVGIGMRSYWSEFAVQARQAGLHIIGIAAAEGEACPQCAVNCELLRLELHCKRP